MAKQALVYDTATGKNEGIGGTSGQVLRRNSAGTEWQAAAMPYDVYAFVSGTPSPDEVVSYFGPVRSCTISATNADHRAGCQTAPSTNTVFLIKKNGTQVGTITYTSASTTGSVAITTTPLTLTTADLLTVVAPSGSTNNIVNPWWSLFTTAEG